MKQWYEQLFANFAAGYEREQFTEGTLGEVDFIEREIGADRAMKILDIGCGTGRHAIELARRGYAVTGVDLSESMLSRARTRAAAAGVRVAFEQGDARALRFRGDFDLAIMMCEGGFPLMETDEMNYQILQSAAAALKEHGKLILTTLNGLFPLFHSVKEFLDRNMTEGAAGPGSFNLMTFRERSTFSFTDDDGNEKSILSDERYYVPCEMTWLLKSAGFTTVGIFGCKLGAFSRDDALTTEDYEMLVVAER